MKNRMKKLQKGVAILLCFFIMLSMVPISTSAASSTAQEGYIPGFSKLKEVAGKLRISREGIYYGTNDNETIRRIIFLPKGSTEPYEKYGRSDLGNGVYVYFDKSTGSAYLYTNAEKFILGELYELFEGMFSLEEIDFGSNRVVIAPSGSHSATRMFYNCKKLKSVDLSGLGIKQIHGLGYTFYNCESLKSIKFGDISTTWAETMSHTFFGCESLESLDLKGFNTKNAKIMDYMFARCRKLKNLDVSGFDTSGVIDMKYMFGQCNSLESLDLSKFNTKSVTDMTSMFEGCEKLETLDLSSFDTTAVTSYFNMFGGCLALKKLNISSFDMTNSENSKEMLGSCISLNTIDTPKVVKDEIKLPVEFSPDNNRDGAPDSDVKYTSVQPSIAKNHLIRNSKIEAVAVSEGYIKVNEGSVEYLIYPGVKVIACKISAAGSVKIDAVTVNGTTYKVTEIADGACKGNGKIKSLTIGDGVTRIGNEAFSGCRKLKKVTISANKNLSLGKNAFKKIYKKAVIKVKGVKGKAKKKLVKAIKKQTNAAVK